jgi:hypothetical protein
LKNTKAEINTEIERRNLTQEEIENLIKRKLESNNEINKKNKKICPRCKSDKLTKIEDIEEKLVYKGSFNYPILSLLEKHKDTPKDYHYQCIVCGYDLRKKYKKESIKTKVLKFFGMKKK